LTSEHAVELPEGPEEALAAAGRAAEAWGAEIRRESGRVRLALPVVAGLRRGMVSGPLTAEPTREGSRLVFRQEDSFYRVQPASVVILLLAVVGAVLTCLWPFFPRLISVAPFGIILALCGWFLVISRLRSSGPDDFLGTVGDYSRSHEPSEPDSAA